MKKLVTFEWEIRNTKEGIGYRTGVSKVVTTRRKMSDIMNTVIEFANNLPSWELKRNNIDLNEYRESPTICRYHYETKLSKIIKIENYKEPKDVED